MRSPEIKVIMLLMSLNTLLACLSCHLISPPRGGRHKEYRVAELTSYNMRILIMILRAMTTEMIMISIMISLAIITDLTSVLLLKVFASTTEFTAYTMNNHSYQTVDFHISHLWI